jgi:AraC-like DNA-binding protein
MRTHSWRVICWRLGDTLVAQLRAHGYAVEATTLRDTVIELLQDRRSSVLLLALPADGDGRETWAMLDVVQASHPRVAPIAVAITGRSSYAAAFQSGRRPFAGLVTASPTFDLVDLERLLRRADHRNTVDEIMRTVSEGFARPLSPPAETLLRRALHLAHEPVSMESLAQACQLHERSLCKYCTRHGLPEPQRVIAWARTLMSAHLLDDHTLSSLDITTALGFPSPAAMRKLLARCTGASLAELRAAGALRVPCRQLEAAWHGVLKEPPRVALMR